MNGLSVPTLKLRQDRNFLSLRDLWNLLKAMFLTMKLPHTGTLAIITPQKMGRREETRRTTR